MLHAIITVTIIYNDLKSPSYISSYMTNYSTTSILLILLCNIYFYTLKF